jgi:hypothetical protein
VPKYISADLIAPTPERMRRGVELIAKAIPDDDGRPSQPYRSIDILAAMERRGAITAEMRQAGEDFTSTFRRAYTGDIQASDPSRPFVSGTRIGTPIDGNDRALESVCKTMLALGGMEQLGASCVWHVLGWGQSLTEWATEQGWRGKRVHIAAAPMVLITALGVLAGQPKSS